MSWPDKDGAGGEVRAESSLGRKTGDPATDPQLKVFGNSELGYKSASECPAAPSGQPSRLVAWRLAHPAAATAAPGAAAAHHLSTALANI